MSYSVDVAQGHKTHVVEEETSERAVAHVLPGEGVRSLWVMGELVTYKIPSHQVSGAYALFEVTTQPGAGPPPHIHHREDEAFYVLEGEDQFLSGEETLRVGAGSLLYVPKGTLHAHEKVGGGMGRMLMTQTPGGLYKLFFEKAGRRPANGDQSESPAFEDRPEAGRITEMAAEHSIEIPSLMGKGYSSPTSTSQGAR